MSLSLITDRTAADINRANNIKGKYASGGWDSLTASEQAAFHAGLKGTYNYTDLNRVEAAVESLVAWLNEMGYSVSVDVKTDWTAEDIPCLTAQAGFEDMERYRKNIERIRSVLTMLPTTPETPQSMKSLSYEQANYIEQILADVESTLTHMGNNVDTAWAAGTAYTSLYAKEVTL